MRFTYPHQCLHPVIPNKVNIRTSSGKIASHAQRCMDRMELPEGSAVANATSSDATPALCRPLDGFPPVSSDVLPNCALFSGTGASAPGPVSPAMLDSACETWPPSLPVFFLPKVFALGLLLVASGILQRHAHRASISRNGKACRAARSPPGLSAAPLCTWCCAVKNCGTRARPRAKR